MLQYFFCNGYFLWRLLLVGVTFGDGYSLLQWVSYRPLYIYFRTALWFHLTCFCKNGLFLFFCFTACVRDCQLWVNFKVKIGGTCPIRNTPRRYKTFLSLPYNINTCTILYLVWYSRTSILITTRYTQSVNTRVSRSWAFQPRLVPWVERLDDTTSITLGLTPRRAVAVGC